MGKLLWLILFMSWNRFYHSWYENTPNTLNAKVTEKHTQCWQAGVAILQRVAGAENTWSFGWASWGNRVVSSLCTTAIYLCLLSFYCYLIGVSSTSDSIKKQCLHMFGTIRIDRLIIHIWHHYNRKWALWALPSVNISQATDANQH